MAQRPPPRIVLPAIAGALARRGDLGQFLRLLGLEVLQHALVNADAFILLAPVLTNLGHPFGVPRRASATEHLMTVSVNSLVLRCPPIRDGPDDRLRRRDACLSEGIALAHRQAERDPRLPFDARDRIRMNRTVRPTARVLNHVHLNRLRVGLPEITRHEDQHRLQSSQQFLGIIRGEIGVQQKVF